MQIYNKLNLHLLIRTYCGELFNEPFRNYVILSFVQVLQPMSIFLSEGTLDKLDLTSLEVKFLKFFDGPLNIFNSI